MKPYKPFLIRLTVWRRPASEITLGVLTILIVTLTVLTAPESSAQNASNMDLTKQAIQARIRQIRTADVTLTVLGTDGKPLANTQVIIGHFQ